MPRGSDFTQEIQAPLAIEGVQSTIEVMALGGAFQRLRGAESVAYDAGERETSVIYTFEGTVSILGPEGISPITITVPAWIPHLPVWSDLRTAKSQNSDVTLQITTKAQSEVLKETDLTMAGRLKAQIAINTEGEATITGTEREQFIDLVYGKTIKVGHLIAIDGQPDRVITDIAFDPSKARSEADSLYLEALPAPNPAQGAADFAVKFPQLRFMATGAIQKLGSVQLGASADGALGTELVLQPRNVPDLPELYTPPSA